MENSKIKAIIEDFDSLVKDFTSTFDESLLLDFTGYNEAELNNILSNASKVELDKVIFVQHCIEIIMSPAAIDNMKHLQGYIEDLFSDPDFRIEPGEDGELKDKDVEQLNELKDFITTQVDRKLTFLENMVYE